MRLRDICYFHILLRLAADAAKALGGANAPLDFFFSLFLGGMEPKKESMPHNFFSIFFYPCF